MSLDLGTLRATITGDTSGLEKAERVAKSSAQKIDKSLKGTEKQVKNTTKALGGIGRKAGQAGIQIQQFVGQIQGGQSVMLAFSQQSADLGFVLGAPLIGAITGIAATIIGVLLPSLFSAKDATEELEDSMKRLDDVAVETGDGIEVLSKKLIELAQKSQQAAKAEIQSGILSAMNAIKIAAEETDDILTDLFGSNLKTSGNNALFLKSTLNQVAESLEITTFEAGRVFGAFRSFNKESNPANLQHVQNILDELAATYGAAAPKVVNLAEEVRAFSLKATSAQERIDFLKSALVDLDGAIESTEKTTRGQVDAIDKYIKALEIQVGALGLTGEALAEYEANIIGATDADKAQIVALKEKISAFNEARIAVEEDKKSREKAQKEDERSRANAQKKLERIKKGGLSEEGKVQEDFEGKMDALRASLELEQLTKDEFAELELQNKKKLNDDLQAIERRRLTQQLQLQQQGLSNLASFHSAATDLIEAAGKEGTAIAKAAFLAGKAIQVAQIIAATQVASIQAGSAVSGGGPIPFFATSAGIEALGFAKAALVAGLAVGQGFEDGGIVGGNSPLGDRVPARVNSGEMILNKSQQSRLFSMANGNDTRSGNQTPSVNIINNGSPIDVEGVSVSRDEITLMINNQVKAGESRINQSLASGRGDTFQALQKGSRVERRL